MALQTGLLLVAPVSVNAGLVNVMTLVVPVPEMETSWLVVVPVLEKANVGKIPAVVAVTGVVPMVAAGGVISTAAMVVGGTGVTATGAVSPPPPPQAVNTATIVVVRIIFGIFMGSCVR